MATTVAIQLTLDEKNVITGLRSVNAELNNLPRTAKAAGAGGAEAFNTISQGETRALDATRLFNEYLGVQLPRTMTKLIATSSTLGPALSMAFNASVVLALGMAVVALKGKIAEAALTAGGFTKEMQSIAEEQKKANLATMLDPKSLRDAKETEQSLQRQIEEKNRFITSLGKEDALSYLIMGYGAASTKAAQERLVAQDQLAKVVAAEGVMQAQITEHLKAQASAVAVIGLEGYAAIAEQQRQANLQIQDLANKGLLSSDQLKSAQQLAQTGRDRQSAALAQKNAEETRKLRDQVVQGWLDGDSLILAKEQAMYAGLDDLKKHTTITEQDLQARRVLYHQQAEQEMTQLAMKEAEARGQAEQDWLQKYRSTMDETAATAVGGFGKGMVTLSALLAREDAETQKSLQSLEDQFDKTTAHLTGDQMTNALDLLTQAEVAIIKRGEAQKDQIMERERQRLQAMADETLQMQEAAALAIAPPWQRADMEISLSAAQRIRSIDEAERSHLISSADAAARTAAVWQEAAGKVLDAWTNAFEDLFNGGWSKMIENNAKKFMARIAAQLTLQSGLGGILGPILGLPTGMGGTTNAGGTAGFGSGTANVGASALASALGLGGGSTAGYGFGSGTAGGGGLTPYQAQQNAIGQWLGGQPSGTTADQWIGAQPSGTMLLGVPALSSAGMLGSGAGSSIGGLKSMAGGAAPLLAALLGGKLGGTAGTLGAGLLGTMMFGPQSAIAGLNSAAIWLSQSLGISAGAAAGLMVGAGSGLLGFGVGQKYGTGAGIGIGAGSGLLLGLALGLPGIGTVIAGIIGLLGGLFGGLFGGAQREKQAKAFVAQQKTAADKIEAQFKSFQLDYPTALADLEQIRSNASDQLRQLKGEGQKAFSRDLAPYLDKLEGELKGFEDERERRSTLAFAPPQFAAGGYTGDVPWTGGWGGAAGVVHPREYVFDENATSRIGRASLDRMAAGGGGGDTININISTQDAASFETWLKRGGGDVIAKYARGRRLEGRSF